MDRIFLASLLLFFVHSAWADEPSPAPDDDSASAENGEMKESGGFVNMKPATDYDAPEPEREPASEDGDDKPDEGGD